MLVDFLIVVIVSVHRLKIAVVVVVIVVLVLHDQRVPVLVLDDLLQVLDEVEKFQVLFR
jgi:hypothetical protein